MNITTIKQLKELLERFGITPTPKNIKIASSFNFQNLEISLENAAIGEFEKMRSAVIKRNRLKI